MDYRRLFEDNLELIEQVVGYACRRRGFVGDEGDDFRSYVHLKLIDQDYAVLRKFRGNSTLKTYLVTVITRLGLDYRIEKWGKWRPSKKTERLGPNALLLERLLYRDNHTLEEAVEMMRINYSVQGTAESLRELAAEIPQRTGRRFETEDALSDLAHANPTPDEAIAMEQNRAAISRVRDKLQAALSTLDVEDRVIVRMRYDEGLGVSTIARALSLEQKPLYRRFTQVLKTLRSELERNGVSEAEIRQLLGELSERGRSSG